MGLTTSLYTGLSGLNAASQLISISGNNISNVNTNGYKAERIDFESQFSQSLGQGSGPTGETGGTNPSQIGLGVQLGATTRNFKDGSLQPTGVNSDLAISGNGFFMVEANNQTFYTRAGSFKLDRDFNLVTGDGAYVQGYTIDSQFNIIEGSVGDLNIPLGALTLAQATRQVSLGGQLNADGAIATQGSITQSNALYSDAAATIPADAATLLDSLYNAGGTQLFTTGDVITLRGATRGGGAVATHTFEVGPANTTGSDAHGTDVQSFMDFLRDSLGIDTSVSGGVAMVGGQLTVTSNTGTANAIVIDNADITKTGGTQPFTFSQTQDATGESVRTTFLAYDSLGTPLNIDLSIALEQKTTSGTTWRFYVQSDDNAGLQRVLGTGTLNFDTNGRLLTSTGTTFGIDRAGTGAASPQQITLTFSQGISGVSALANTESRINSLSQDGAALGTLYDFSVEKDGTIKGKFTNTLNRSLGRVVLATFTNPQGLIDEGSNLYSASVNSGTPSIMTPGQGGAGSIASGSLEMSNVDLSQEFINLISASTGFSANSRVLTTSDRLIQELVATIR